MKSSILNAMSEFIKIGEIIGAVSEPIKFRPPAPIPGESASTSLGGPNSDATKTILFVAAAIGVGLFVYYLYQKKYEDENTPTRNKPLFTGG